MIDTLRSFGLTSEDFVVRLSSRNAWHGFYCEHHGQAADENIFCQIIDKLDREGPETNRSKLAALGFSLEQVEDFIQQGKPAPELQQVLDNLEARGLREYARVDYWSHPWPRLLYGCRFEAFDRQGEFRAIAGGGRYDNLVKLVSGGKVDLPALGFGMGDVVLLELLKARGRLPKLDTSLDAFCLIEDQSLRGASLKLIHDLRSAGLAVDYSLTPAKSDKQFKRAQELNAACALRLDRAATGELLAVIETSKPVKRSGSLSAQAAAQVRAFAAR